MVCDHQIRHIPVERRRLQLTAYANKLPRLSPGGGDRGDLQERARWGCGDRRMTRSGRTDLNVRRQRRPCGNFDVDVVTAAITIIICAFNIIIIILISLSEYVIIINMDIPKIKIYFNNNNYDDDDDQVYSNI